MMLGPLAGGLLYEIGGYITPFLVLGIMLLVLGVGCYFIDVSDLTIYSAEAELNDVKTSILSVFKQYEVWPCALSNMLSLTCLTFKEPILATQLGLYSVS